jgi:hypothetical protein
MQCLLESQFNVSFSPQEEQQRYYVYCLCSSCLTSLRDCLFTLDGTVYVAYEGEGCSETDGAQHQEEAIAHAGHVAEEERRLHEPAHVRPRIVVVEAVPEDEQTGRTSAQDAPARGVYNFSRPARRIC